MNEPFIGITCDVHMPRQRRRSYDLIIDHRYAEIVKEAAGYPVILPLARRPNVIQRYLDGIDGLIIVGGDDVDPRLYGERLKRGTGKVFRKRLEFEIQLYHGARRMGMPILGICYGMQLINVLEGGALFQDIRRDAKSLRNHRNRKRPLHRVRIERSSRLGQVAGRPFADVWSEHHQAVSRLAPGFRPVAFASDGIIEAIENDDENILAVQWHPECTPRSRLTRSLMRFFLRRAQAYMKAP
jgi:putative glutamine amidotransferase